MLTNLYLRTSCGLIELSAFDRIGRITKEAYEQVHTEAAFPFDDCKFVVMGYFPHYARLSLPAGGTLPVQSRGTPWVDKFGDPLFGVPHDAAFQAFLQMLAASLPSTHRGPVVLNVVELERNVPVEPIGRQERPIMIGVPPQPVTPQEAEERMRQLQAILAEQASRPLLFPAAPAPVPAAEWMAGQMRQAYQAQAAQAASSEYFRFAGVTLAPGPNRNGDVFRGSPIEIVATRRAGSDQLEILSRSPRDGEVPAARAADLARAGAYELEPTAFVPGDAYLGGGVIARSGDTNQAAADHPVAGEAG